MQNNLEEYYWMVNFCKPNLLGTYKEYKNLYSLPINSGQKKDANDLEVQKMTEQSAVLFMTLNETVHRQDESILIKMLPKRQEYLIKLRLTPIQEKLYERYMNIRGLDEFMQQDDKQDTAMKDEDPDMMNALRGEMKAGLFSDKLKLETLCFHPGLLQIAEEYVDSDEESMGSFIDDSDDSDVKSMSSVSSKKSTKSSLKTSDTYFLIQMSLDELVENAEKNYKKITEESSFRKTFKPDNFAQIYRAQLDSEKISVVRRLAYTFHFMVSSVIEYSSVFKEAVDQERIVVMPEQLEHAKAEKINKMVNLLKQHFRDQGKTNEQELLKEISSQQVQNHIKMEVEKSMKTAKKFLQQGNIKKVSDAGNHVVESRIKADASTKAKKEAARWFQDGEIGFEYDENDIDVSLSGKTALVMKIIQACSEVGEKIVIATQRLDVLNQLELILKQETQRTREFRKKRRVKTVKIGSEDESEQLIAKTARENSGRWYKDTDYFRIDGSVSVDRRMAAIKQFNKADNIRARLMILSTKAGGIGINLIGASRMILLDVSFNPANDKQALFRIYRLGQTRDVKIYRFVADGTMENAIFKRQIDKMHLSNRVVDEKHCERHYTQNDLKELYKYKPDLTYLPSTLIKDRKKDEKEREDHELVPPVEDKILQTIMVDETTGNFISNWQTVDSLLVEDNQLEKLTEKQKQAIWKHHKARLLQSIDIETANEQRNRDMLERARQLQAQQAAQIAQRQAQTQLMNLNQNQLDTYRAAASQNPAYTGRF